MKVKSILFGILFLCISSSNYAAPGTTNSYLINDPLSVFDFGLYKMNLELDGIATKIRERFKTDFGVEERISFYSKKVTYDWETDKIKMRVGISLRDSTYAGIDHAPTSFQEPDLLPLCRFLTTEVQEGMGLAHRNIFASRQKVLFSDPKLKGISFIAISRPNYYDLLKEDVDDTLMIVFLKVMKTGEDEKFEDFSRIRMEINKTLWNENVLNKMRSYFGHAGYQNKDAPENWEMDLLSKIIVEVWVGGIEHEGKRTSIECQNSMDKDFYIDAPMSSIKRS